MTLNMLTLAPNAKGGGHVKPKSPRLVSWTQIEEKLDKLKLNGLAIVKGTLRRRGYSRIIDAECSYCGKRKYYYLDALLRGLTKGCVCQRNRKYLDPRAELLGGRYDTIVQRCNRDTHKQSKDYKGKGVKSLFKSREDFVIWALKRWPTTDFKGLEFDRYPNRHGHYSPDNLRLVTSRDNHLNRDGTVLLSFNGKVMHWSEWPSPYAPRRTQALASLGLTGEAIIQKAKRAVSERRKGWKQIAQRLKALGYQ